MSWPSSMRCYPNSSAKARSWLGSPSTASGATALMRTHKGEASRKYGAYRDRDGFSERALFVIDADGIIRWSYLSDVGQNPGADGVLAALEELTRLPHVAQDATIDAPETGRLE